mgnify:CR=1 FL=1
MPSTLSRADADTIVRTALRGFASDGDLAALPNTEPLRTALDLDSLDFLKFSATFAGGACGVWRQSIDGDTGDIVC